MLRKKLHQINIIEFASDSVERALMFLLGLQCCYYTDEIKTEDNNVLNVLQKYNINYKLTKTPNNRIMVMV